jgi:Zn-dependent protease
MATCTFHPERAAGRLCTRCGRPACAQCLQPAQLGSHCPDCMAARPSAPAARFGRVPPLRQATSATNGPLSSVVRPGPTFLLIVVFTAAAGWWTWRGEDGATFALFRFVLGGWVVSLCLHEFAHALAAYAGGDRSVVAKGYLTLDPLRYTEPGLSLLLPLVFLLLGGIGLPGGAVWIEVGALRSRAWRSAVSFAGPATNLVLAAVLLSPFAIGWLEFPTRHLDFTAGLAFLGLLQVVAAVLNLVPLPGLDGFGVVEPYLPRTVLARIAPWRAYSMLILFLLVFQVPAFNDFIWAAGRNTLRAFAVPDGLAAVGYHRFQFWN